MEAKIINQAQLQNEKLNDFQEENKFHNKTLLKAIHHMSSSLTNFINWLNTVQKLFFAN